MNPSTTPNKPAKPDNAIENKKDEKGSSFASFDKKAVDSKEDHLAKNKSEAPLSKVKPTENEPAKKMY